MGERKKQFYIKKNELIALVQSLQRGEGEAKEAVTEIFRDKIFGHIVKRVDNPKVDAVAVAEDLIPQVFDEIFANIHKLRRPEAFVTWCNRIVENKVRAHFRAYRKEISAEHDFWVAIQNTPKRSNDDDSVVEGWLSQLPAKQANAVRMHHLEGLSVKEIAQCENVSVGTIKSRLFYGRKTLEKIILKKD